MAHVVEADWGWAEDPSFSGPLGKERQPVLSDRLDDVPAVAAAREHGYEPAPEAPLWCFVPAIWPPLVRLWVPDPRVRTQTVVRVGHEPVRLPWATADYAELELDINAVLSELGLPARPPGRVWLLSAPPITGGALKVLDSAWADWLGAGERAMATPAFVHFVRDRVRETV